MVYETARTVRIPVFGIVDSNTDPTAVDYPIPANDDSLKTIKLIVDFISNKIIESLGVDKVIFLTDEYLAKNVAKQTNVKIITWHGTCIVHERFTAKEIREYRKDNPGITILAHPECTPEVVAEVDFTGSTSKMSNYVKEKQPNKVLMVTECSMSDNVSVENPNVEFVRPCNLCPHMKRISLVKVLESLMLNIHEVKIDQEVIEKARLPIERMLQYGQQL